MTSGAVLERNGRRAVVFDFLSSDYPLLLTVLLMIWLSVRRGYSWITDMISDRVRWARFMSRAALAAIGGFLLWTTVFDNWRQLLGYLMSEKNRWRSDPYLLDPPPDAVRIVTWVWLALAVLGGAMLYARYARGYLVPIVAAPVGLVLFYVLNSFRVRFELVGPLSDRAMDLSQIGETIMILVWFAMFYVVIGVLIICAYAALWGPTSILIGLIYRNTFGRQRIEEPEMFRIMRERSLAREDKRG